MSHWTKRTACLRPDPDMLLAGQNAGAGVFTVPVLPDKQCEINRYFPPSRFKLQRGLYESGKSENAFYTFSAGGVDWLVLVLELWPRQGPIDWAKTVAESHPHHNVIVLAHSFLTSAGTIKEDNGGYGDTSPQWLFEQLILPYANMRFVLSGHVDSSAWRVDHGAHGNAVYEILQCCQLEDGVAATSVCSK